MSGRVGSITTDIIADGLVFNMDAANRASYPAQRTLATSESGSCYNTLDLTQSGSFISDPQFITEPISASCWGFDGVDDYIDTNASFDSNFTLSAWINCDGTYAEWVAHCSLAIEVSNIGAPNGTIGKLYTRGALLEANLQMADESGANWKTYFVIANLKGAGWKHCVWTFNNTTKEIYFYLDGVAQVWTGWGGTPSDVPYLTAQASYGTGYEYNNNLSIGFGNTTSYFDGKVGNIQVYNRTLNTTEVLHNYNALKGRFN